MGVIPKILRGIRDLLINKLLLLFMPNLDHSRPSIAFVNAISSGLFIISTTLGLGSFNYEVLGDESMVGLVRKDPLPRPESIHRYDEARIL